MRPEEGAEVSGPGVRLDAAEACAAAPAGAFEEEPLEGGNPGDKGSSAASEERQQCAFFLRTGTCAYGDRCKFEHPADRQPPIINSRGYPIRRSEPDCTFFIRKGWCAFGVTCKYNHPELPTPAVGQPSYMVGPGPPSPGMVVPYAYYSGAMVPMAGPGFMPRVMPMQPMAMAPQQGMAGPLAAQMGALNISRSPYMSPATPAVQVPPSSQGPRGPPASSDPRQQHYTWQGYPHPISSHQQYQHPQDGEAPQGSSAGDNMRRGSAEGQGYRRRGGSSGRSSHSYGQQQWPGAPHTGHLQRQQEPRLGSGRGAFTGPRRQLTGPGPRTEHQQHSR